MFSSSYESDHNGTESFHSFVVHDFAYGSTIGPEKSSASLDRKILGSIMRPTDAKKCERSDAYKLCPRRDEEPNSQGRKTIGEVRSTKALLLPTSLFRRKNRRKGNETE